MKLNGSLRTKFYFNDHLFSSEEPNRFITNIKGKLFYDQYNEDSHEKSICIGIIDLNLFRLNEALNYGERPFDIFDCVDDNVMAFYEALFDGEEYKNEIIEKFNVNSSGENLLVVDKIRIHKEFRGRNYGKYLALRSIGYFMGTGYIAVKPFPLQFSWPFDQYDMDKLKRLHLDNLEQNKEKAFAKIQKFWTDLGFQKVNKEVYLLNSDYLKLKEAEVLKSRKNR